MCASLSALRPLASHYLPSLFSHLTKHTHGTENGTKLNSMTNPSNICSSWTGGRTIDDERDGRIYVSQTFDVYESRKEEWDGHTVRGDKGEDNSVVVRTNDSQEFMDVPTHTRQLFERSSEEELVEGRRVSIIGGNRR